MLLNINFFRQNELNDFVAMFRFLINTVYVDYSVYAIVSSSTLMFKILSWTCA